MPANPKIPLSSLLKSAMMAALTGVLAFVTIPLPFTPVPVTGQTLGVMLSGSILGPWMGAASMIGYLGLGCLGFPVFAGGRAGPATLVGPTGGYLWGFVAGAWATGFLMIRFKESKMQLLLANIFGGVVVLHLMGAIYLSWHAGTSFGKAFLLGSAPFLAGDMLKAAAVSLVAARFKRG